MLHWIRSAGYLGEIVGFLWFLQITASGFLLWRRKWLGASCLLTVALLTFLAGGTRWPTNLLANLEKPYARNNLSELPACDVVVVLGGGLERSVHGAFGLDLGQAGDRLITGMELVRLGKAKALFTGGGFQTVNGERTLDGELFRGWMEAWGFTNTPIVTPGPAANTREEALEFRWLAQINGWKSALLVSSASHLRRAEAVFKNVGVPVVSVGCDFRAFGVGDSENRWLWIPHRNRLEQLDIYLHEIVGWHIYAWRGWTQDNSRSEATSASPAP
jgi:uncharacterized SAM-binding protein YcdF (DUF218 family)